MTLWQHPLVENDLRQCLRIAVAATLGFGLSKVFNWDYGVFFTVTPVLMLGLVPLVNGRVLSQFFAAALVCGLEVGVLGGLFGGHPGLMSLLVFFLFLYKFACMSKGSLFLFGAYGAVILSIMLNFGSYPETDINTLIFTNLWANLLSAGLALLVSALIPDATPRAQRPPPAQSKASQRMRHEALLGATIATLSFLVFQTVDLLDSLSAQTATVLLLFPMHWNGALGSAQKRAMGTLLGVFFGIAGQLLLYNWSGVLLLVIALFWMGCLLLAYAHVKEGGTAGVGLAGLTTLGVLFGQYLTPDNDLVFSALYRVSSVLVAIVATLLACYLVHRLLNRFEATRFGS